MNPDSEVSWNESIELIFHDIHDHGVDIAEMWMKEVTTRSGGRVRFKRTGGEDPETIKTADIVRDVPASDSRYSLLNLIQIPCTFPNSTVGCRVIARLYAEFPELRTELSDEKVVGLGIGASMAIFSNKSRGPIRTIEDFKGARIRSVSLMDRVLEAFGAQPVRVGWFEMSRMLETEALDAAVLGILPAYMFGLADGAAPYCTVTGNKSITMHPMRIYMKWDAWNRLPLDIQEIIEEIGPAGSDCWYAIQSGMDSDSHLKEALEYIKQKGEIIKISPQELERWQRLILPVQESTLNDVEAEGLPALRFYNRMIDLVNEYS